MIRHEQDFIMRQIQMLMRFVARILFGKDSISAELSEEEIGEMGELYNRLNDLLQISDICNAEDMLHDNFTDSKDYLRIAIWFYNNLNTMTDEELETSDFSREEIHEGLQNILSRSGIPLPTIM